MRPLPAHALDARRSAREEDDDPATVDARMAGKPGRFEHHDDPTVQLSRMPLSFISESVMDPETVHDPRPEAARWREDTVGRDVGARDAGTLDEVPPGRLPSPPPSLYPQTAFDRSSSTLARAVDLPGRVALHDLAPHPVEPEPWLSPRMSVLAPLLAGALGGIVFILILLALYAGSP